MTARSAILLVVADALLRQAMAEHLEGACGLAVAQAGSAAEGLARAPGHGLIVVDDSLADLSAAELCAGLHRQGCAVPLLVLAAAGTGFAGCPGDAVLPKPLKLSVLAARVAELLARAGGAAGPCIGGWRLDAVRRVLEAGDGRRVRLTAKETEILERLVRAAGATVSREVLLAEVWGYGGGVETHTLETHVYRLRRKLAPGGETLLLGEDGGYRLGPVDT